MKRCPLCSAFASNDATTCFDCLYSFKHMTPLEDVKPAARRSGKDTQDKQVVIPAPSRNQTPKAVPVDSHTTRNKPTIITIRIDSPNAEVRVEHDPAQ